jgi:X-X-X-Leu-X-X-Gly heptad repeat protein
MRNFKYLLAATAVGGLMALPQTSVASPLATGLGTANSSTPAIADGLVQRVHGWHCSRKWSKRLGKHRHRKACYERRRYYDDDDYYYDDYSYYRYGYPSYGYAVPFPFFFGFNFDDDDGRRRHRGHKGRRGDDD